MNTTFAKSLIAALAVAASSVAMAAPVSIQADFTFTWPGDNVYTGHIGATDSNNDGLITKSEVTSIFESLSNHNSISQLYDIGTIDIATKHWTANGISWNGYPNTAFMTFDNRSWSCTTYNGCSVTFTQFETRGGNVPEPASIALLAVALVGAGVASRKRQVR
ncbi:PEP-CTERM sorting domain-containing protein [Roseateles paludis]|jgi:hypothetical protein|uniref:PEP-CTERM sorting domain-containing protein n=1 Tax=Roseateles paludis TaxID=3145238 RepID=A0ABV0G6L7_9BURK